MTSQIRQPLIRVVGIPTFSPPPSNRTNNGPQHAFYPQASSVSPPVPSTETTPPPLYTLPLNSNDLGKLPLYCEDTFWNTATSRANLDTNTWYLEQDIKAAEIPRSLNNLAGPGATAPPAFPSVADTFYEQRDNNLPLALLPEINPGNAGYTDYVQDSRPQAGFVYGQPQSGLRPQEQPMEGIMDADTMALWNNAPSGFK